MWTFLFFIFSISTKNEPNFKVNEKELGDDQTLYPTSILIDESSDQIWSPHKIDRIGWTATADSEQTTSSGNQGPISNILDGNPNTIWHSKYNNDGQGGHDNHKANGPFQITINLGRETRFKAFSYMPRQDGDPNGKFRLYEFFTAKTEEELTSKIDESNYTAKGYIDNITLKSTLVILPRTESAQYIALRTLNHDSFGSCAEFNLYRDPTIPTPTPLAYLISESRDTFWSSLKLDRTGWTATANNEQSENAQHTEGPARFILDGKLNTMWHTVYNNRPSSSTPLQFTIDLGQETTFKAFSYMPRQSGENGRFRHYEFYAAHSSEELNTKIQNNEYLSKGDIDYHSPLSTLVVFYGPQTYRFVALRSLDHDTYATCVEFNLFRNSPEIPQFFTTYLVQENEDQSWNPYKIDRTGWTATANSEQNVNNERDEGPVSFILDGVLDTKWHSNYNTNGHDDRNSNSDPFQATINLGKEITFKAFAYMPRQKDVNGKFEHYEFYAAKTLDELNKTINATKYLAKGDIDNTTTKSTIVAFESPITAQYVAILSLHFYQNYATMAEFNLFSNEPSYVPPEPTPTPLPTPMSTKLMIDETTDQFWSSNALNRSEWKLRANSEQVENNEHSEGPISFIVDGNVNTMWHSRHNNGHDERQRDTDPYQITIDLGKQTSFKAFAYRPRTGPADANGRFRHYEFYTANTSEELFTKIRDKNYLSEGDIDSTTLLSTLILFKELQTAQHIALLSVNYNRYGTCAEFNLYREPFALEPDQSVMTNQEGLINITCDKFTYENWPSDGQCVSSSNANFGSISTQIGAKARVKFYGVKVHLLALKEAESGLAYIHIDDSIVAIVDFRLYSAQKAGSIIFTSNDLEYGEHTIEIETLTDGSIIFASVYVNPLPKENSFILGFSDFTKTEGEWTSDSSTPPVFTSESEQASGTFDFYGTRFWLTGVRGNGIGDLYISIDEGELITVSESKEAEIAQNNKAVCLYDSGVLDFKMHNVKIQKVSARISLMNFLYTWYPNTEIPAETPSQSPAESPTPTDVIIITPDEVIDKRVNKPNLDTEEKVNIPTVKVDVTNFTDIKYDGDFGGAIYVTNYGLECSQIKFDNCSSESAGGGIYIKNENPNLDKNISLVNLDFNECKAIYGGAVYVYSYSELTDVLIKKCMFSNNEASDDESFPLFGGSSIFLTTLKGFIIKCKFVKNKGTSVKLNNEFESTQNEANNLLLNNQNFVLITKCDFVSNYDKTKQDSSLFYVRGKHGVPCEIRDCSFTGELSEGSHYINGKTLNENGHKLSVKNCRFNDVVSKSIKLNDIHQSASRKNPNDNDNYDYLSIDLKYQQFKSELKVQKKQQNKFFVYAIFAVGIVIAGLIVVVVLKKMKNNNNLDVYQEEEQLDNNNL